MTLPLILHQSMRKYYTTGVMKFLTMFISKSLPIKLSTLNIPNLFKLSNTHLSFSRKSAVKHLWVKCE